MLGTYIDVALTSADARAIAKEVFLWGMHPVGIYHLRYHQAQNERSPRYTGINRLHWDRQLQKALPHVATTPNATTLYGVAALDVTSEPAVITVDEVRDHYWSVHLHDNYARYWHMIGSQFNAPGPVRRLIVGPSWKGGIPPEFVGADIVESPSNYAGVIVRVALTDDTPEELAIVNAIQDRITVMSLGAWIAAGKATVKAEDVPVTRGEYPTYPGMETVKEPGHLGGVDFLRWASLVLNDASFTKQADGHQELAALERFARLGLKRGAIFDPANLPPDIVQAIERGIEDGKKAVAQRMAEGGGVKVNGWEFLNDLGYKDTDWVERSRNGFYALLAPVPSRSHVGAFGLVDSEDRPLDSAHRYTITFDMDDLPPVTEFWEMPIYDREGYFIDNPLDRYSLNSYMLAHGKLHTADGKLVLYVQRDAPADPDQKKNWLPTPQQGGFQFAARFYGPHGNLIDASYAMPGVVRVD